MRYIVFFALAFHLHFAVQGQTSKDFEVFLKIPSTELKDQQSSGTCWSFATTSFIETEALRLGKDAISLSPIFYVTPTYLKKAEKFIERKGESWFEPGDLTFSVLDSYEEHGAIPEEVYKGIVEEDWQHDHLEMDNLLSEMVKSVGESGYGRIKPNSWKKSVAGVLHAYLGKAPTSFLYQGKEYTPRTFADTFIGIDPDDYVEITSYSNHEFYQRCIIDIPANWSDNKYLNLPIQDFEKVVNHALENGYSLAWDGDATEPGFDFETGLMELPDVQEESEITQELRQKTFDDKTTTDDHNMHIIGMARDKAGKLYYLLKNSEGENSFGGYIYMSKNALLLKTISVLVHQEAIPVDLKKKTYLDQ